MARATFTGPIARTTDVGDRLAPFTACTYLRLTCKAWRLARPGWRARLEACLTAAKRAL